MARFRFRLSCKHWTYVLDAAQAQIIEGRGGVDCDKCGRKDVLVGERRTLSDAARLPSETRKAHDHKLAKDTAELRRATQGHDHTRRHTRLG